MKQTNVRTNVRRIVRTIVRTGIGQDSHRFLSQDSSKPCIIGGIIFEGISGFAADSDGDVIFHALCNALSSLTGIPILGGVARELCLKDGITDSGVYVEKALSTLKNQQVMHVAFSVEAKKPRFEEKVGEIRKNVAKIMDLDISAVGLTVTSGDGLSDFGCGDGMQCFCVVTTSEDFST